MGGGTPQKVEKVQVNTEDQRSSYAVGRRKLMRLQGQVCVW